MPPPPRPQPPAQGLFGTEETRVAGHSVFRDKGQGGSKKTPTKLHPLASGCWLASLWRRLRRRPSFLDFLALTRPTRLGCCWWALVVTAALCTVRLRAATGPRAALALALAIDHVSIFDISSLLVHSFCGHWRALQVLLAFGSKTPLVWVHGQNSI